MLFLFLSLLGLPHVTSLAAAIAVATLAGLFIHVASTPYVTLLPDLTPAEQRSTASGVMNFLGTIGGIVYFVIASEMWDEHPVGTIQMVAFVFLGCMLVPVVVLKEPEAPHLPVPQVEKAEMSKRANLLAHLKSITRETEVMKYLVAKFLWAFGLTIVWTFITLFVSEDLGVSEGKALWTHMVGTSVAVCFMLPLGMLGDRVNRKWLLFSMMALWTLLIVLLGFAQNFAQILRLLGISGISYATLLGVGYAFFLDLVPEERVGEFVGINAIVWAAPLAVAPLVAGALIDALGYRPMFLLAASFLAIGLVVFLFVHPRQRKETAWE
jgi:MFS family permease